MNTRRRKKIANAESVEELLDWYDDDQMTIEQLRAKVAQLREALLPLLDEIGTGSDMDYHMRTDGHAERLKAALTPDDWLAQHDAEVRERCAVECDEIADTYGPKNQGALAASDCAAAIRDLGATE